MKFNIQQKKLNSVLSKIKPIIPAKSSIPVLGAIQINAEETGLLISATNLDVHIKTAITGETIVPGICVVDYNILKNIVANITGDIAFEVQNNKLVLRCSSGKYVIPIYEISEWPEIRKPEPDRSLKIAAENFDKIVTDVSGFTTTDALRTALMGVLLKAAGDFTCVATDGYRVAKLDFLQNDPPEDTVTALVPVNVLKIIQQFATGTVSFGMSNVDIFVTMDGTEIIGKQIEGKFPRYETIIPAESKLDKHLKIDRISFMNSIRRVKVISSEDFKSLELSMMPNEIDVSSVDAESGASAKETLPCEFFGTEGQAEPFCIKFNADYLYEAVSIFKCENIIIKFSDRKSAAMLFPETQTPGENYWQLLMPIRMLED